MTAVTPVEAPEATVRHYLLASDFDQTFSFNDSGLALATAVTLTNVPS